MRYLSSLCWAAFACLAQLCFAQQGYGVDTLAGTGVAGFTGDGSAASRAQLNAPVALAFDSAGRLYIADTGNKRVRRVETNGRIGTVASSEEPIVDIAVAGNGTLYIASASSLRAVSAAGVDAQIGERAVGFSSISAIAAEPAGTILVASAARIFRIDPNAIESGAASDVAILPAPVTSLATGPAGIYAVAGDLVYTIDAAGAVAAVPGARASSPLTRVAADRWGDIYLSGVRVTKVIAGKEYPLIGLSDPGYSGDGGPSVSAAVNAPAGLVVDRGGNVYFADTGNQRIRLLRPLFGRNIDAILPRDGAQEVWPKDPTLVWTTFLNPATYEVFFGSAPDSLARVDSSSNGRLRLGRNLADRTRYYWQVRTQFPPQPPIESPVFSFSTTTSATVPPPQPGSPTPPNNSFAQSISPSFSWSGGGAIQYQFYLGTAATSLSPVGSPVTEPKLTLSGLAPETTYYWQVISFNEAGASVSPPWNFTTGPVNGYPWLMENLAGAPLPVSDGLNALDTILNAPRSPASDASGNIYFLNGDRTIRRIGTDGKISTTFNLLVGSFAALTADPSNGQLVFATPEYIYRINPRTGVRTYVAGQAGRRGFSGDDGPASLALFDGINALAANRSGAIYVADTKNNRVRAISPGGQVRTLAGTGICGESDGTGPATSLALCAPSQVAVDSRNNVYVCASNMLLRIDSDGAARRIAGTGVAGYSGDDGPAAFAQIGPCSGLAADRNNFIYLADSNANTIRIIDPDGKIVTWAGAAGPAGGFAGDGQPTAQARFASPTGISLDLSDSLLIADTGNYRIRRVDGGAGSQNVVRTIAGMDTVRGDRGTAASAFLYGPTSVAIDPAGNTYIADSLNSRIRRVSTTRAIETVAGGGTAPVATAGAVGRDARDLRLDLTTGGEVAIDGQGNLVFSSALPGSGSDSPAEAVIAVLPNSIISSFTLSRIGHVGGIVRGRSGDVYVSDSLNHRIVRMERDGTISAIAGTGSAGASGDGGQAVTAQLNTPRSLALSPEGDLYVAEVGRIRKITAAGGISTAAFENAAGLAFDKDGFLYVSAGRSVYLAGLDRRVGDTLSLVRIAGRENGLLPAAEVPALEGKVTELRGLASGPSGELVFADLGENAVRRLLRNVPAVLNLVSGDNQTVNEKFNTPNPILVRVTGRTGVPVAGITVRFVHTPISGSPAVLASLATDANGVVVWRPFLPMKLADISVEARVFGVSNPVRISVIGRPTE